MSGNIEPEQALRKVGFWFYLKHRTILMVFGQVVSAIHIVPSQIFQGII